MDSRSPTVTRLTKTPPERAPGASAQATPALRVLIESKGGSGLRTATHLKALDALDGQKRMYLHLDSDHGDRYATTLPDGTVVALQPEEMCLFGWDDARSQLSRHPALARRYQALLRGNPVSQTYKRGAAQCRPMGLLQYELSLAAIFEAKKARLNLLYPPVEARGAGLSDLMLSRETQRQMAQPMLNVHIASAVGGQGSAIVIHDAYATRWLCEQRGIRNVTHIGVLLGPNAFQRRERNIELNYAAVMRELEAVYRDGFTLALPTGEHVTFAKPPFDELYLLDLAEWPRSEDPDRRLSDTAMDAWLRQVALTIHTYTQRVLHDRLESLLLNLANQSDESLAFGSLNAAMVFADLAALNEVIALDKAGAMLDALLARCRLEQGG